LLFFFETTFLERLFFEEAADLLEVFLEDLFDALFEDLFVALFVAFL
jgi:hypothetical protein